MRLVWLTVMILSIAGCGDDGPERVNYNPAAPDAQQWEPKIPTILTVSPSVMSVGDELTILGSDFIPGGRGDVLLSLVGTFTDDEGNTNAVSGLQVRTKRECQRGKNGQVLDCSKLTWRLYPNNVFHPQGNRLGKFVGQVSVINATREGTQLPSVGFPVEISVQPSLIPTIVRPSRSPECESVVRATLENTRMTFSVEAVGLRPGTPDAPLTFHWTFMPSQWKVRFNYDDFVPEKALGEGASVILEDRVTDGLVSTMKDEGEKNVAAEITSSIYNNMFGEKRLSDLSTMPVGDIGNNRPSSVHVAVTDATGKAVSLTIPITIHRQADMIYDGTTKIAERMPPKPISSCMPGGEHGRNATYRDDKAETHARSYSWQYNGNAAVSLGLPSNPFALGLNLSLGFGVDVNHSVSSQRSEGLDLSGQILPGEYGIFYRQTTKVIRVGKLVGFNACGTTMDLGQVHLTDWLFTPELATGLQCEPESRLPPAGKYM